MVLAVYIPPQPPGPGQAHIQDLSLLQRSHITMVPFPDPFENRHQSRYPLTFRLPGAMGTTIEAKIAGISILAMAIIEPDVFYHSPDGYKGIHIVTTLWQPIESAMISRDVEEKRIPGVPIAIPSATVMVPNWTGQAPASFTPSLAQFPKSHEGGCYKGFSAHVEITPTIGFQSFHRSFPSREAWHGWEILPCYRRHYYDGVCLILSCHSSLVTFLPL